MQQPLLHAATMYLGQTSLQDAQIHMQTDRELLMTNDNDTVSYATGNGLTAGACGSGVARCTTCKLSKPADALVPTD